MSEDSASAPLSWFPRSKQLESSETQFSKGAAMARLAKEYAAALYVRVNRTEPHLLPFAEQKKAIREWAWGAGFPMKKVFIDEAPGYGIECRPGLRKLLRESSRKSRGWNM